MISAGGLPEPRDLADVYLWWGSDLTLACLDHEGYGPFLVRWEL